MLEELSKHDEKWRSYALKICGCRETADDIVQDMYLKIHENQPKFISDRYIYNSLMWIFLERIRTTKEFPTDIFFEESHNIKFEPDDTEREILERVNDLNWWQVELLEENYHKSLREISEESLINISYGFIHRELTKARQHLLGENYDELYNNSRLKHKK